MSTVPFCSSRKQRETHGEGRGDNLLLRCAGVFSFVIKNAKCT